MNPDRAHLDRISTYVNTLPDHSGTPRYSETSTPSLIQRALCLAANLHNPSLIRSLTTDRTITQSAADLETISQSPDISEDVSRSMRHVAGVLRKYEEGTTQEPTIPAHIAESILGISGHSAGAEVQGYTFMGTDHVNNRDHESVHLVAFRDPNGDLYGFYAVRRFGRGEGQELQLDDEHSTEISLLPLTAHTKSVQEYRVDYSRHSPA